VLRRLALVLLAPAVVIGCGGGAGLVGQAYGFRLNWTASAPEGLWRERPLTAPSLGSYVLACPTAMTEITHLARERGYLADGDCPSHVTPLLKQVAATPGDVIELRRDGFIRNGGTLVVGAVLSKDGSGRPIPGIPFGVYRLNPTSFWLVGTCRSLDSRYYGPFDRSLLIASVEPVLTWSAGESTCP
jgi:conjugative transfer signal peptidase TraF